MVMRVIVTLSLSIVPDMTKLILAHQNLSRTVRTEINRTSIPYSIHSYMQSQPPRLSCVALRSVVCFAALLTTSFNVDHNLSECANGLGNGRGDSNVEIYRVLFENDLWSKEFEEKENYQSIFFAMKTICEKIRKSVFHVVYFLSGVKANISLLS